MPAVNTTAQRIAAFMDDAHRSAHPFPEKAGPVPVPGIDDRTDVAIGRTGMYSSQRVPPARTGPPAPAVVLTDHECGNAPPPAV
jgi:hypothetical protein